MFLCTFCEHTVVVNDGYRHGNRFNADIRVIRLGQFSRLSTLYKLQTQPKFSAIFQFGKSNALFFTKKGFRIGLNFGPFFF
jgi:hypothetical protein